jgi:aldehyde:ferredoxin oxidoreductase
MYGFNDKLLRIDLTLNKYKIENLQKDWVERYIGGKGLGIRYLYSELMPNVDPLSPDNKIIIATGPLTGTIAPLSGKYPLITKSPLTNTILDSYSGSHFGVKLKFLGYDMLIIQGRSSHPSYIYISEHGIEIKDARRFWGMGTHETVIALREEVKDKDASVLTIGPAGENLSRIASIVGDGEYLHARGGPGAVMGSKNLKAIVVESYKKGKTISFNLYDPDRFKETVMRLIKESVRTDLNLWASTDGTPIIVDLSNNTGVLPTRDYTSGFFEFADGINTIRVKERLAKRYSCFSCPLVCKRKINVHGRVIKSPEYETLALIGSNLGIGNIDDVAALNYLADNLGLDTISLGSILGFITSLYKDGIISKEELGEINLDWGYTNGYIELIKMIAYRKGIGNILADGVKRAAEKIGRGTIKYTMEVKGLEVPGYEPRGTWGMAIAYATSDRGACHLRAWVVSLDAFGTMDPYTFKGKAEATKKLQDLNSIKWSLIICDFWTLDYPEIKQLLKPAIGKEYSENELQVIGERIWNLSRMFNVREGFKKEHDRLPEKVFVQPLKGGKSNGKVLKRDEFENCLKEYYILRGWNPENGIPTNETLQKLGLKGDII